MAEQGIGFGIGLHPQRRRGLGAQLDQSVSSGKIDIRFVESAGEAGCDLAGAERQSDVLLALAQPEDLEAQGQDLVDRRGRRNALRTGVARFADPPDQRAFEVHEVIPRHRCDPRVAERGEQQPRLFAEAAAFTAQVRSQQDLVNGQTHRDGIFEPGQNRAYPVPRSKQCPAQRESRPRVRGRCEPTPRGAERANPLVQRNGVGIAPQDLQRSSVRIHDDQVAVANFDLVLADVVAHRDPIAVDDGLALAERAGGKPQSRSARGGGAPGALHDQRRLAVLRREQSRVAQDAAARSDDPGDRAEERSVLRPESRREEHRIFEVFGTPAEGAEDRAADGAAGGGGRPRHDALAGERRGSRGGVRAPERLAQGVGLAAGIFRARVRRGERIPRRAQQPRQFHDVGVGVEDPGRFWRLTAARGNRAP